MNKRTAKELLISYLENINYPDAVVELFADDATIELPYLKSLGMRWQWQGKQTLHDFLKGLPVMFPGFEFENIRVHIDTLDQVFGEYDASCIVASTGLAYHQSYMGWLVAENGKIKLLREGLDLAVAARTVFPNEVQALEMLKFRNKYQIQCQ